MARGVLVQQPMTTQSETPYAMRPPLRGFPVYEYATEPVRVEDRTRYRDFLEIWLGQDFCKENPDIANYPYDLALQPVGQLGFAPFFGGKRLVGRKFEATAPYTRAVTSSPTGLYEVVARPRRGSAFAAGFDLCAATSVSLTLDASGLTVYPQTVVVPTGLGLSTVALPEDSRAHLALQYAMPYLSICSRSGLAVKGVSVANAPGIIDLDYEGEIKVILQLLTRATPAAFAKQIDTGTRIAQAVPTAGMPLAYRPSDCVASTARSVGGFGSTGLK